MSKELLPCPFCGSKHVRYVAVSFKYERDEYHRIKCDDCWCYGPIIPKKLGFGVDEAGESKCKEKWNTRQPVREKCKPKRCDQKFTIEWKVMHLCNGCNSAVQRGDNYCPGCGSEINWPEEGKE